MSANRAIAASQRRRVIAGNNTQPVGKPGPVSSIGSAQVLSQRREQNHPQQSGRLAGQHAAYSQKQAQQQAAQAPQSDVTRLTVAQAITLITLRLGKLETSMMQLEMNEMSSMHSDGNHTDNSELIDSMQLQINNVEKDMKSTTTLTNLNVAKLNNLIKSQASEIKAMKAELAYLNDCHELHQKIINSLTCIEDEEPAKESEKGCGEEPQQENDQDQNQDQNQDQELEISEGGEMENDLLVDFSIAK